MPNDTSTLSARVRVSATLSAPFHADTPRISPPASFPVSRIARESHPRVNLWAGLAEGSQILAEAEAHKGAPLSQAELRALQMAHLDVYDPQWAFHRRGISDAWMSGWAHAFALAAQQIERTRYSELLHGIGLMAPEQFLPTRQGDQPTTLEGSPLQAVRFRKASILVHDPADFFQGVWEGQMATLDEQRVWAVCSGSDTDEAIRPGAAGVPVTAAWCFDELLDLLVETGNYGLDFVVGYVLGYSEGLLCGRTFPPAKVQAEGHSA